MSFWAAVFSKRLIWLTVFFTLMWPILFAVFMLILNWQDLTS